MASMHRLLVVTLGVFALGYDFPTHLVALSGASVTTRKTLSLDEASVADIHAAFRAGTLTAERLTAMSLTRITTYDRQGPTLRAIIALNPKAIETARALDAEWQ